MYSVVDDTSPTRNAPLKGGKASIFEGGVRVPMIVAWPNHIKPSFNRPISSPPSSISSASKRSPNNSSMASSSLQPSAAKAFSRDAIFTYFPHDPPVPDWIPPSVSVHHEN
jgi:hypothetical protein